MTTPRSSNAAPVIRRGSPNRRAQPLVHSDSPSVGMGNKGFLAGTRHRGGGVLAADAFRNGWPCLPWSSQEADVWPWLQAIGRVDGDETPRLSTSYTGTAILNFADAPGRSARHLRRPSPGSGIYCAAEVSQMQTPTARVGQVASVRRRPQASVTVRKRSSDSQGCDASHIMATGSDRR